MPRTPKIATTATLYGHTIEVPKRGRPPTKITRPSDVALAQKRARSFQAGTVRLVIRLPPHVRDGLRRRAAAEGVTMRAFLTLLLAREGIK